MIILVEVSALTRRRKKKKKRISVSEPLIQEQ